MPRYFFHVFNAMELVDDEGREFPDLAAAEKEARHTAADLIRDEIRAGRRIHPGHRVEIEDEQGNTLNVLRFGDFIAPEGEG